MCICFVPSKFMRLLQRFDSNCRPRFVVIVEGTLKREIQMPRKACETVSAVLSVIRTASGQCVNLSMWVKMYTQPLEGGKGPTRYVWK